MYDDEKFVKIGKETMNLKVKVEMKKREIIADAIDKLKMMNSDDIRWHGPDDNYVNHRNDCYVEAITAILSAGKKLSKLKVADSLLFDVVRSDENRYYDTDHVVDFIQSGVY